MREKEESELESKKVETFVRLYLKMILRVRASNKNWFTTLNLAQNVIFQSQTEFLENLATICQDPHSCLDSQ